MTDEQAERIYDALKERYGDDLPSFEHEPRQFAHFVKMFRYYQGDLWDAMLQ